MKSSGKKRDLFWNSKLPEPRGFCTRDPSLAFQPLTLRFMTRTLPRTSYPAAPTPVSMQLPSNPRSGWGGEGQLLLSLLLSCQGQSLRTSDGDSAFVVSVSQLWSPQKPG